MAELMEIIDKTGGFEGQMAAFSCDALGTMVGSLLGTAPVTTFIESAAGNEEGGRTGKVLSSSICLDGMQTRPFTGLRGSFLFQSDWPLATLAKPSAAEFGDSLCI